MLDNWKALAMGNADPREISHAYWISGAFAGIGFTLLVWFITGLIA